MPGEICSEAYVFSLEILEEPDNFRLEAYRFKFLLEDLCLVSLHPKKIHRLKLIRDTFYIIIQKSKLNID